ncbi:MAG: hypothetical protein V2A34_02250 [Lentisphaerota bacterium]
MGIPLWWITELDLMVGCDLQDEVTATAPPVAVPMTPHVVAAMMHWALNHWSFSSNVVVEGRKPCSHTHDIKYLIPHIPIPIVNCVMLPAIIPMSQSKILLGAFTVICNGKPVGVHGLQINCDKPVNLPTGTDIPTRLPTVWCGFGLLDLLFSLIIGAIDVFLSWGIGKLLKRIPFFNRDGLTNYWVRTAPQALFNRLGPAAVACINGPALLASAAGKAVKYVVDLSGYRSGLTNFMSGTVAGWNPHATPARVAKAADESVFLFADMIYDRSMHGELGIMPPMQEELAKPLGEEVAERIVAEARADMTREEWRSLYEAGYGKETREVVSQSLWDYCDELNAQEGGTPPHA